jgi:gliding motility-associated-like protein
VENTGSYSVRVSNNTGCQSLISASVEISENCQNRISFPDMFTPNGDGINDIIKPVIPGINRFRCMKIFNRWGNLIFETLDPNIGWDGKFKGVNQPAESYIWLIEGVDFNGKDVKRTGMFTLMR